MMQLVIKIVIYVVNVWKDFKMNTMKHYHNLFLKIDILSLACVFETFRKESTNYFELDSPRYLSAPR